MTVVDLHPEELLDKDARGALTDVERARLEAHCAQCVACRAERQLRLDFSDERSEDGIEEAEFSSELIAIALGSAKAKKPEAEPEADPEPKKTPSVRPAAKPRRVVRVLLLAAAAFLGVTAAAANQSQRGSWLRRIAGIDAPVVLESTTATEKHATTVATQAIAATPIATPTPAPIPEPVIDDPPPPSAQVIVPVVASAPVKTVTAATMFDDANEARRRGDYARAVELHRQLQAKHPSSREAQVSRATLGRLLLDRGDLGSALASFDDYLAHGHGELDEAVMVGRATALDRLGRTADARRAWQALLDAFPSSPYAEHARSRTEPRD